MPLHKGPEHPSYATECGVIGLAYFISLGYRILFAVGLIHHVRLWPLPYSSCRRQANRRRFLTSYRAMHYSAKHGKCIARYCDCMSSVCPSDVRDPSVTLVYQDQTGWKSWKLTALTTTLFPPTASSSLRNPQSPTQNSNH